MTGAGELGAGLAAGIRAAAAVEVELADRDAGDRVVDRRGGLLEPGLDLGDGGQRAEPRLVDLLEQGDAAGDERGGEAGSFHRGGAGVARGGGQPLARGRDRRGRCAADRRAQPLGVGQEIARRSVAVTLIVPATIAANPSPCWPVKLLPVAAMTGMFMAVSCPINWVTCWPAPPSLANQFWA